MSKTDEQPISAVKKIGDKTETREFTPTQWANMGKDKAGWKPAKPAEALLNKGASGTAPDAALLNARERYAALFEKQPAANATLDQLEAKIAKELDKQNNAGDKGKAKTPAKPAAPVVATGALPPANASTGDASTGGDADANKAAADADKGPDAATN